MVLPVIIEKQGFRAALSFIVTGTKTEPYLIPSKIKLTFPVVVVELT